MVVYIYILSTLKTRGLFEIMAVLVYIASFRLARAT